MLAPLFKNIFGFVFVMFDGITRTYFNCSQYAMYTVCILFSTRTTKTNCMCEGASKQSPNPKISTASGPRPSVLKFRGPPLRTIAIGVSA